MIILFILFLHTSYGYPSFPVGDENYIILNANAKFPFGADAGLVNWNSFLIYFYHLSDPCTSQGLEVNLRLPNGDYLPATRGWVSCSVTKESLGNVVRKLEDDTLIFRLADNKCRKVTFVYQNSGGVESVVERDSEEYSCNDLLSPEELSKSNTNVGPEAAISQSPPSQPPPPQPSQPQPSQSTPSEKKPPAPAKTTATPSRFDDELER